MQWHSAEVAEKPAVHSPTKVVDFVPADPRNRLASLAVLAGWTAAWIVSISIVYSRPAVLVLISATVVLVAAVAAGAAHGVPSRAVVVVAAAMGVAALQVSPPLANVKTTPWLLPAVALGGMAPVCAAGLLIPLGVRAQRAAALALLMIAVSYAGIILGGVPLIDVWVLLQDSTSGLLAGHNPYELAFPGVPPGQDSWCFTYLPGTFLLTAPGNWLLGDVRWAEAACLVAATGLLMWHAGQRSHWMNGRAIALAAMVGVLPVTLRVVQQAWTESLLLVSLVVAAVLIDRGRAIWAAIPLGLALATKQHMVVLLPLIMLWPRFEPRRVAITGAIAAGLTLPWFFANPGRFLECTSEFFLGAPASPMSLSVWQLLPAATQLPVLILGFAVTLVLVLMRCPRTGGGFLIGSGVLLAVFSLLNKQSFLNQWWFAGALVVAGFAVAVQPRTRRAGSPEYDAPSLSRSH